MCANICLPEHLGACWDIASRQPNVVCAFIRIYLVAGVIYSVATIAFTCFVRGENGWRLFTFKRRPNAAFNNLGKKG